MIYRCCDENRRMLVRAHPTLNGIDYVEILDSEAPAGSPRQRTLLVRFVKPAPPLTRENFDISGGDRIRDVAILWATPAAAPDATLVSPAEAALLAALPDPDEVIALRTDSSGDHSTYGLHLVAAALSLAPPAGIDPLLATVRFSFKVECASDFDCAPEHACPEEEAPPVAINYLAKDYRSFRRLMLDRMAQTIPEWRERNAADLGVALVEMLAYVGDRLSYAQDAVATEAYLGTARRRSSVRRHARLVDYAMHDGANARAWVQVAVFPGAPVEIVPGEATFLTRLAGIDTIVDPAQVAPPSGRLLLRNPTIFEPLHAKTLHEPLNEIFFHDWGDAGCCLAKGAVRATLRGDFPMLSPGDVLVFEERIGPRTGREADADPARRWAVRLVQVVAGLEDAVVTPTQPITEIRWADGDALPFPFCLSATTQDGELVRDISHALGNILLADHGQTIAGVDLGTVPEPHLHLVGHLAGPGGDRCDPPAREAVPPRYRPVLRDAPVTQAGRYRHPEPGDARATAGDATAQNIRRVAPQILLDRSGTPGPARWEARRDLLGSRPDDPHFVVETESDGSGRLRFGDGRNGLRPGAGARFTATYRIGSGPAGNIGADALAHVATGIGGIRSVRNPLAATGGIAPESIEATRVAAPEAFRTQERAVTPEDYATIARRHPDVQRAAATFRWNGHGHTVFVTVDRFGAAPVTAAFEAELIGFLEPYRMAGYDLEIDEPRYVPVEIAMLVCVKRDHFRPDVRRVVLDTLSERRLPDGRSGLFHPDRLTFDQDIWLSPIIAAVQAIDGVESVTVTVFGRQGDPDPAPLASGILPIGRLEIAQLANDPDYPERGKLTLTMGGGK